MAWAAPSSRPCSRCPSLCPNLFDLRLPFRESLQTTLCLAANAVQKPRFWEVVTLDEFPQTRAASFLARERFETALGDENRAETAEFSARKATLLSEGGNEFVDQETRVALTVRDEEVIQYEVGVECREVDRGGVGSSASIDPIEDVETSEQTLEAERPCARLLGVAPIVEHGLLDEVRQAGEQNLHEARVVEKGERLCRGSGRKKAQKLLENARRGAPRNGLPRLLDGLPEIRSDFESETSRELDGSEHPNGIFLTPESSIADRSEHASRKVLESTDVVDHAIVHHVEEEGVDRKIASEGVFFARTERIVANDEAVFGAAIVVFGRATKRRDFDDLLAAKEDVDEFEAPADDAAVGEETLDLARASAGRDVEVLRRQSEQKIAHAPANEVGLVAVTGESFDDLDGLLLERAWVDRAQGIGKGGVGRGGRGEGERVCSQGDWESFRLPAYRSRSTSGNRGGSDGPVERGREPPFGAWGPNCGVEQSFSVALGRAYRKRRGGCFRPGVPLAQTPRLADGREVRRHVRRAAVQMTR